MGNLASHVRTCTGTARPPASLGRIALVARVQAHGHHLAVRVELAAHGEHARVLAIAPVAVASLHCRRRTAAGAPVVAGELAEPELLARYALVEARVEAGPAHADAARCSSDRRRSHEEQDRCGDGDGDTSRDSARA
uniref:Uncharacterized protein n=1 Tax=Triticum urartu TaxID=4572 RepID=A0A8R7PRW8_TRIUA